PTPEESQTQITSAASSSDTTQSIPDLCQSSISPASQSPARPRHDRKSPAWQPLDGINLSPHAPLSLFHWFLCSRHKTLIHVKRAHEAVILDGLFEIPLRARPDLPLAALSVQFPDARRCKAETPLADPFVLLRFKDQKNFRIDPLGEGKQGAVDGGFFG